jgi:hypothetical protein
VLSGAVASFITILSGANGSGKWDGYLLGGQYQQRPFGHDDDRGADIHRQAEEAVSIAVLQAGRVIGVRSLSSKPVGVKGCVSASDSNGRTIWIADAYAGDGKRFVVRADEKLTAFIELEPTIQVILSRGRIWHTFSPLGFPTPVSMCNAGWRTPAPSSLPPTTDRLPMWAP